MAFKTLVTTSLLAMASLSSAMPWPGHPGALAAKITCPVVFSGQIPINAQPQDFDTSATSLFNPGAVKGNDTWSQIIKFPGDTTSGRPGQGMKTGLARFDDAAKHKAFEVTLNDRSIFKTQFGFRRAGLIFKNDTNSAGPGNTGVKTLHWSVRQDLARPLNLTHEYLNVWHEAGDWSSNHFHFTAGSLIGRPEFPSNTFKILNRKQDLIWSTPINMRGEWQSFAVTLNYDANTIQVYYSPNPNTPLKPAFAKALPNDNSGFGQFQMGALKKPTGDTTDVVNKGYQPAGINEGQIYGGVFLENGANGCVSL
ncbi:glycoside hydrolase 131 catalytic N-terminal domain-containing protein [Microdochium nivale]|nr:glycoside hydrolase 131 catalytic N-terminal domain-containing protein [Microdochium nivale]